MKNEQGLSENVRNALCQYCSSWDKLCYVQEKGFAAENRGHPLQEVPETPEHQELKKCLSERFSLPHTMATGQGSAPQSKPGHQKPRKGQSHGGGTTKQMPSIQTVESTLWEGIQKARLAGACSNVLQQESLLMAPPALALIWPC